MKVYISVDMEGVAGVVNWKQTGYDGEDYSRFRKLMTSEANAAVQGAFDAGADTVVVNDGHGSMRNLVIEELDSRAELISGNAKPMSMAEGLDESFEAVLLIGYHSMAGSPGVLNHTYTGSILEFRVNERRFGETGMLAALAGYYSVPVAFISGDDCTTAEAEDLIEGIHTACVKQYSSRYAARSLHPEKARKLIYQGVKEALNDCSTEPLEVDNPVVLSVKFNSTALADGSYLLPGAQRVDPLTVQYTAADYHEAYRAARALISLGFRG